MNSNLPVGSDINRFIPLYCRLMGVTIPGDPTARPAPLEAQAMDLSNKLLPYWNPQKALTEVKTFSSAVSKGKKSNKADLAEGIKAFRDFITMMDGVGPEWYSVPETKFYGDGSKRWKSTATRDMIDEISENLYLYVDEPTPDHADPKKMVEDSLRAMMHALDAIPYIFSPAYEGKYSTREQGTWSMRAMSAALFLETIRKVNAK